MSGQEEYHMIKIYRGCNGQIVDVLFGMNGSSGWGPAEDWINIEEKWINIDKWLATDVRGKVNISSSLPSSRNYEASIEKNTP